MARYEVHQKDGNADTLCDYMRAKGASVAELNRPVDIAVGFAGVTALAEIKMPKGKLEPGQMTFLNTWTGLCVVLRTEADCDELLRALRQMSVGWRQKQIADGDVVHSVG